MGKKKKRGGQRDGKQLCRIPEAPRGWPKAMAPPAGFTRSGLGLISYFI